MTGEADPTDFLVPELLRKVRELAATLKKTPDGMSHALARGVRRRADDERFRVDPGKLDRVIATGGTKA